MIPSLFCLLIFGLILLTLSIDTLTILDDAVYDNDRERIYVMILAVNVASLSYR